VVSIDSLCYYSCETTEDWTCLPGTYVTAHWQNQGLEANSITYQHT